MTNYLAYKGCLLAAIWKKNSRSLEWSRLPDVTEFKGKTKKFTLVLELLTPEICLVLATYICLLVLVTKDQLCFWRFISHLGKCSSFSQPIEKYSYIIRSGIITPISRMLYSRPFMVLQPCRKWSVPFHWICISEFKFIPFLRTHSKVLCI